VAQQSRLLGYVLIVTALIASAVALVFGYFGGKLIYLAATFGGDAPLDRGVPMVLGILSYISVVTAATLFPLIAVVAAAIAWVCWRAGRSQI
jgi:hypothetical protein